MDFLLDFILHIDQYMVMIVRDYHAWTYAILFFIIFCETGLVVTPFLPGDSLLFVAGAISALPDMPISVHILVIILFAAAVLGDSCNYMIGHFFGRFRYELNKHWLFITKFGETVYLDRNEIGSGNDLICGNKKADVQMQLRIKF